MPLPRTCSECGKPLSGKSPRAKTCGPACRSKRMRRLHRGEQREAEIELLPEHEKQMIAAVRREAPDSIHAVMKEELRPIIREALTEDTLRAIQALVNLTPRAVELIGQDLESDDALVRQKAYTLLLKYTAGHPAVVKPEEGPAGNQINVSFELPRPEQTVDMTADDVDVIDLKQCDMCHADKPVTEFVANSNRCQECMDRWKNTVTEEFNARLAH